MTRFVRDVALLALAAACVVALGFWFAALARADEAIYGTAGPDVIHANTQPPAATSIYGLAGDDRIWGGRGHDEVFGGPGVDRLHNFQAASGLVAGGAGRDVCVVGLKPNGSSNVQVRGCEVVRYRDSQGHGG